MFKPLLTLGGLALLALICAKTLSAAAAAALPSPSIEPPPQLVREIPAKDFAVAAIFERASDSPARPKDARAKSLLPLVLQATWVPTHDHPDQEYFAGIRRADRAEDTVVSPGEAVFELAVLESVHKEHVVVRNLATDELETLRFSGATPRARKPQTRNASTAPFVAHVQAAGKDRFVVERAKLFEIVGGSQGALMRDARVLPHIVDGQPAGFKVHHLAPGSVYQALGLQRGDVISGVSGRPLHTLDDVLNALSTLSTAPAVELHVERGGRVRTLNYELK